MNKKTFLLLIIIAFAFSSCNYFSKYPDYKKTKSGIYYKLLKFGESTEKAKPGDYMTVDIKYKTIEDSVFFEGRRKLQITDLTFAGAIDECFLMLSEDEMASFIISANDFFTKTLETTLPAFINEYDPMIVDIDVIDIQTEQEYFMEKEAFLYWIEDFGDYEKVILRQFIEQEKFEIDPSESGLYHILLENGNGNKIFVGDTVTVHYEGKFLNGKFFDSTKRRNSPFQFVYGRKWQVIKGMEEAIGSMTEGEKALFIIPSQIGFGETGSSTGIIPPYTSTLFEVELVEVIPGTREKNLDLNKYD
ncbi:MAG: FKBP-type peptidyl-prolyl cis-trans isomerase [Candidatus Marinimicrobia bacterium]|jgi:FKBP-type peptidyl-prolyl cis-trans isomerase FkpA|nr:FKBP-type peptidyl-prolyl cis-trans isomerase [Candidatus Neomarinimicrobiota bacterium]